MKSEAEALKLSETQTHHHLPASPEHVHWGYLDAGITPALRVRSGDRVTIDTVSGGPETLPPADSGFEHLADHLEVHAKVPKGSGNHIFTGPVYVEGALPGDVLEVRILAVELRQNWGWNLFRPLMGTIPDQFPYLQRIHIAIDKENRVATPPWGGQIPINPFFGQLAVAPRPEYGRQNSKEPREFGGNIDCKELTAGSTIYLPVWTEGALFSTGDGHAAQGDGEVCGTALETALTGTFDFIVRKDLGYTLPRAETPRSYITLGLDASLDNAARQAVRAMVEWLVSMLGISPGHAYSLCSFAADLHVTQTVNNVKGIHCMIDKALLAKV